MTKPRQNRNTAFSAAKYVAFLRGINVGGNRIIKSADLKSCFESMSLKNIIIILQSGNVIFECAITDDLKITSTIEKKLQDRFSYPAKVVVKSLGALAQIVDDYPFPTGKSDVQYYVVFLSEDLAGELTQSVKLDPQIESIKAGQNVVYWKVAKGMTLKSEFGKLLSKARFKELNTVRNLNTLQKILNS